jgi:hypothetical protein
MTSDGTNECSKLPELIKIDDITSGKVDPAVVNQELDRLKVEINVLRNDMALFLKAIASISTDMSQQDYYHVVVERLKNVQQEIKQYCVQYNRLLPIINLAQIKLGHEVENLPNSKPSSFSGSSKPGHGGNASPKRRRSSTQARNGAPK